MIMLQKCAKVCSFAINFCWDYADATTFPTIESEWTSKENKVKKIFIKPGGGAQFFDTKNYENWKYLYENYVS